MDSSTRNMLLLIGAGAVGAYLLYTKVIKPAATVVSTAFASASDALASGLYALFGPSELGYMTYARIIFPDGTAHAIPVAIIASDGTFTVPTAAQDPTHVTFTAAVEQQYGGNTYQALKAQDGSYQAFPAAPTSSTAAAQLQQYAAGSSAITQDILDAYQIAPVG